MCSCEQEWNSALLTQLPARSAKTLEYLGVLFAYNGIQCWFEGLYTLNLKWHCSGCFASHASYIESYEAHKSTEDWYLCSSSCVLFLFTPGFKSESLVGDGKVEERCTKTLLSPGSVCMLVGRKPARCERHCGVCHSSQIQKTIIVQKVIFFATGEKWILYTAVAPTWVMACDIWI